MWVSIVKFYYTNLIIWILSYGFYHAISLSKFYCGLYCTFYCLDSIIQILLYRFHCTDFIIWILLSRFSLIVLCKIFYGFHYINFIMCFFVQIILWILSFRFYPSDSTLQILFFRFYLLYSILWILSFRFYPSDSIFQILFFKFYLLDFIF